MKNTGNQNILIMACMKDEGPYLLEWLAHYLTIGASKFIIVTNDCTDGTDDMLDYLDKQGVVRHLPNPTMVEKFSKPIQHTAIQYAQLQREFREADWTMIVDADEFLNIQVGKGRFIDLFRETGDFDAMSFNQVVFGNNGVDEFVDEPTALQFNRRFAFEVCPPRRYPLMFGVKTLVRNCPDVFSRLSNHVPHVMKNRARDPVWLDGSGKPVDPEFTERVFRSYPAYMIKDKKAGRKLRKVFPVEHGTHDLGYVNHYALRSLESFIVQSLRGDAVSAKVGRDLKYWQKYNRSVRVDRSIHKVTRAAMEHLNLLKSDPVLAKLHNKAVKTHHQRFRKMIKQPEVRALYDECKGWKGLKEASQEPEPDWKPTPG